MKSDYMLVHISVTQLSSLSIWALHHYITSLLIHKVYFMSNWMNEEMVVMIQSEALKSNAYVNYFHNISSVFNNCSAYSYF